MKISQADKYFSLCIRARAEWKCEKCGTQYKQGDSGLHCSHFIGRGNYSVRFEPLNAFAHCMGCHMRFEANPHEFVEWAKKRIPYDVVVELSNDIMRGKAYRRADKTGELSKHYKAEFEKLQNGEKCFTGWA